MVPCCLEGRRQGSSSEGAIRSSCVESKARVRGGWAPLPDLPPGQLPWPAPLPLGGWGTQVRHSGAAHGFPMPPKEENPDLSPASFPVLRRSIRTQPRMPVLLSLVSLRKCFPCLSVAFSYSRKISWMRRSSWEVRPQVWRKAWIFSCRGTSGPPYSFKASSSRWQHRKVH